MLMMVLCDRVGRVYDVWITFGSVHEVRAFRERKKRSLWFRGLVENCVVYGDRGYVHYGSIYYKFYLLTIQKPCYNHKPQLVKLV